MSGEAASLPASVCFPINVILFFPSFLYPHAQIMEFNLKQKKRMEVVERRDQERLANLRAILEEQARRDRKR